MNHKYLRKNEKNVFCIDCNAQICRHCCDTEAHFLHRRLQICKYVYQDVLRLLDIQHYFDCSEIQTYKINGEQAIHLNSRPQAKDARPSTKSKNAGSCVTCKRYIQDRPNRFCSISCKVIYVISISFKVFPLCIVTLLVMHCFSSFYISSWQKYTKRSDEKVTKMFFDYMVYKLFYRNNLETSKES
ncbi:hypothetical protein F2Q69_00024197 [Brassica cretica]|uniref:B box-type domain-containing protein n=1 Tax=Brassica cretica TaxID=69181 RepID=A0A8S9Q615_BRACR|nr:hypothetical protein F2Q69_00024197 [Brassica cretica]